MFKSTKSKQTLSLTLTIFQPSTVETESEEYRSHNDTESDIEVQEKGMVIIKDVNTVRWVIAASSNVVIRMIL